MLAKHDAASGASALTQKLDTGQVELDIGTAFSQGLYENNRNALSIGLVLENA
jgi:hypothetical protein